MYECASSDTYETQEKPQSRHQPSLAPTACWLFPSDTSSPADEVSESGMTPLTVQLDRTARLLADRLSQLEERLQSGDQSGHEAAWRSYSETAMALASVLAQVSPGKRGELLTTAEMAARLNLAPKTLLKRKARGEIRPALQRGKLIRWRGDEAVR